MRFNCAMKFDCACLNSIDLVALDVEFDRFRLSYDVVSEKEARNAKTSKLK